MSRPFLFGALYLCTAKGFQPYLPIASFDKRDLSSCIGKKPPRPSHVVGASADEAEATLRSITFSNIPKSSQPDLVCDFLLEIGACAAYIVDADRGTDREKALFMDPSTQPTGDWQDTLQWAAPVWNRCNVTAHFSASADIPAIVGLVDDTFDDFSTKHGSIETLPNKDWVVHVQRGWKPIRLLRDTLILRFPWHTEKDIDNALDECNVKKNDAVQTKLQGGIAFGTGEHPTTQLCLGWLKKSLDSIAEEIGESQSISLLDYGSGSGVLGIAATQLGRKRHGHEVHAVGIDIDIDACLIGNANALHNGVSMRSYLPPPLDDSINMDDASKSLLLKAHKHARSQVANRDSDRSDGSWEDLFLPKHLDADEFYDICVANILAAPLITLAPVMFRLLRDGGALGLSGILTHQGEDVRRAFADAGFENTTVSQDLAGWLLVTARKPGSSASSPAKL